MDGTWRIELANLVKEFQMWWFIAGMFVGNFIIHALVLPIARNEPFDWCAGFGIASIATVIFLGIITLARSYVFMRP
jgi:hypothetical protein